jgi:uncharacterized protein
VRAWWRVAFFALAIASAGLFTSSLFYGLVSVTPVVGLARQYGVPLADYVELFALFIATWATLRVVDGPRGGTWARVGLDLSGLRLRPMVAGLAAGSLAILVPCGVLIAAGRLGFERQPAEITSWWAAARGAFVVLLPAAFTEELALRGFLLTTLVEGVGTPFAVAITSVLFALLHLLNPDPSFLSVGMVALAGVFLAAIRLTTGSLWAASIGHLAWNLVQATALHAPVSGLPLPTPGYRLEDHGPAWLTGGSWGPEGGLAAAAGMLVAAFLLVRYYPKGRNSQGVLRPGQNLVQTATTAHT